MARWPKPRTAVSRRRNERPIERTPAGGGGDDASPNAPMGLGKYRGRPVTEVDQGYLVWCSENLANCPTYILTELVRRRHRRPTCALSHLTRRQQKKRDCQELHAERQRAKAARNTDALHDGVLIKGERFDDLRAAFLEAGGDLSACPFDTPDYTYEGPRLEDGKIVPGTPVLPPLDR